MTSPAQAAALTEDLAAGRMPMTVQVYVRLRNALREVERTLASAAPAEAAEDATVDVGAEQLMLRGRAVALRDTVDRAEVVAIGPRAVVGSHVRVRHPDGEARYELVAPVEVEAALGRISVESPLGAALLGTQSGDEVIVSAPGGTRRLKVVGVYHD